jgi:hypothetical protein
MESTFSLIFLKSVLRRSVRSKVLHSPNINATKLFKMQYSPISNSQYPGISPSSVPRKHRYGPTNPQVHRMGRPTRTVLDAKKDILRAYKSDPDK